MTLPSDDELHRLVAQFLGFEAMLLDEGRFDEWLALLDDDLIYEIPLLQATGRRDEERSRGGFWLRDSKPMIQTRIARLATSHAHAECPPSRTIRSVCGICLLPREAADTVRVSSTVIVYRQRGTDAAGDVIHARRSDRLRLIGESARLVARSIILAETSLSTPNLGFFL